MTPEGYRLVADRLGEARTAIESASYLASCAGSGRHDWHLAELDGGARAAVQQARTALDDAERELGGAA